MYGDEEAYYENQNIDEEGVEYDEYGQQAEDDGEQMEDPDYEDPARYE